MMLSSLDAEAEARRCREIGVERHLIKPIKPSDLLDAMMSLLGAETGLDRAVGGTVEATRAELAPLPRLRVLVAEDSPVNQTLAVRLLEKLGQQVTLAGNGKEAVAAAATGAFDLILMDIQMPEMDGLEATRLIRARERQTGSHIPIAALTAHAMKGDGDVCLQAGMDHYLTKPIQVAPLGEFLAKIAKQQTDARGRAAKANPSDSSSSGSFAGTLESTAAPRGTVCYSDNGQILDWDEMRARVADDWELLKELIRVFEDECPRLVAEIRAGLFERDARRVLLAAHTLKGTANNFGARETSEAAFRLESLSRAGDLTDCAPALAHLEEAAVRLMAALSEAVGHY
jgi:CheY-like chemotaxis protein